jgi:hypothetical protein
VIDQAVKFLLGRLNKALPRDLEGAAEDLFTYVRTERDDAVGFKAGAVSILLVRIEEDTTMRPPDAYARVTGEGAQRDVQRIAPEIRLNLYVLFVARFPDDYGRALEQLSVVIRYFQQHRVFNRGNSTDLGKDISLLIMELLTPTFSEQNEIWGALRVAYQPSALYKLKMVVFQDDEGPPLAKTGAFDLTVMAY